MRLVKRSRVLKWLVLAGTVVLSWPSPAACREFEFLYINANEGSASGGHVAIRFGDEVFHFQHVDPGLLRIYRDDFSTFRFTYGYQENRSISGHRIEVSDETFQTLRNAFTRRLLIQNQQFGLLTALTQDLHLLNDLRQLAMTGSRSPPSPTIELKALGYFASDFRLTSGKTSIEISPAHRSAAIARLKQAIADAYGNDFIQSKRQQQWQQLESLKPIESNDAYSIAEDRFEPGAYSFAQHYQNQLLNLAALDILQAELAPRSETLLTADLPKLQLDDETNRKLVEFRQILFADLVKLMQSERSDWGYPMLVGMARLHALDISIKARQLVVLDRFRADGKHDRTIGVMPETFSAIVKRVNDSLDASMTHLSETKELDEPAYGKLELTAGALLQVEPHRRSESMWHLPSTDQTPSLTAKVELVPLTLSTAELDAYIDHYSDKLETYAEKLQKLYQYQLLQRNCATEIFRMLNANLAGQAEQANMILEPLTQTSERLLGGYLGNENLNLIPFVAFDRVAAHYRLASSYRLPAYREQQIQQHLSDFDWLSALAESNTLTSSIYRWHGEDAAFLFFTDDSVWPRPLLGATNLAVAIGQTAYGILALPWDTGKNLQKSLKGMFVSIPELFFFNIRKGSFPQLIPAMFQTNEVSASPKCVF